ncbi:hypothetical protein BDN72DRAFT_902611 [Pluteus cervinus]|uniref:Uncharacterized protein n=1 Tax=Pluteus cervinus TaxID=181527 RepID=A0ACD3AC43_9AGAR|nr:hypothetical protein BDN72DRAFT_902611 [Pluteus cervinus]
MAVSEPSMLDNNGDTFFSPSSSAPSCSPYAKYDYRTPLSGLQWDWDTSSISPSARTTSSTDSPSPADTYLTTLTSSENDSPLSISNSFIPVPDCPLSSYVDHRGIVGSYLQYEDQPRRLLDPPPVHYRSYDLNPSLPSAGPLDDLFEIDYSLQTLPNFYPTFNSYTRSDTDSNSNSLLLSGTDSEWVPQSACLLPGMDSFQDQDADSSSYLMGLTWSFPVSLSGGLPAPNQRSTSNPTETTDHTAIRQRIGSNRHTEASMKRRTREATIRCKFEWCPMTFTANNSLARHLDAHLGRKYPCRGCGRGFSTTANGEVVRLDDHSVRNMSSVGIE